MEITIKQIAHIENNYKEKFGIPRQSGLANKNLSKIVFEKEYKNLDAIRGIEEFSHIWLLWIFTENMTDEFQPMVRPPRLGGNKKVGVFASRSPFRPNPIGLSCVKLEDIVDGELIVSGADIMDGTAIIDIKPYIPYADIKEDASEGYATYPCENLEVLFDCEVSNEIKDELTEILSLDPRPRYQDDNREYKMLYNKYDVSFIVEENKVTVTKIKENKQ